MIIIDLWAGDFHNAHVSTINCETWEEASHIIQEAIETGMLVNVIHSDFMPPLALRVRANQERLEKMIKEIKP